MRLTACSIAGNVESHVNNQQFIKYSYKEECDSNAVLALQYILMPVRTRKQRRTSVTKVLENL